MNKSEGQLVEELSSIYENRTDEKTAESTALTDLEVVCKLMQAYQLLGEVFQHESPMILNLMPECTELFLEQASMNFVELHKRMAAEV